MNRNPRDLAAFAREAARIGRDLTALTHEMQALSFQPDGHAPAELREVANALRGCALRAAMAADDTDLMGELSGRTWARLHEHEGT